MNKLVNDLTALPVSKIRFKWGKSKVSKNIKRKVRREFNKLEFPLEEITREYLTTGTVTLMKNAEGRLVTAKMSNEDYKKMYRK